MLYQNRLTDFLALYSLSTCAGISVRRDIVSRFIDELTISSAYAYSCKSEGAASMKKKHLFMAAYLAPAVYNVYRPTNSSMAVENRM